MYSCCSPRTGGFVIAGFQTFSNGILLLMNVVALTIASESLEKQKLSEPFAGSAKTQTEYHGIKYTEHQIEVVFGIGLALNLFHCAGGVLLFFGIIQESVSQVKIWIGMRVAGIVADIAYLTATWEKVPLATIIGFSLGIAPVFYFFYVSYTLICELRQKESHDSPSASNAVKPHPNHPV